MNTEPAFPSQSIPGCLQPARCPLSRVRAGMAVRIKQLSASPDVNHRLRELGFCEDQQVRLLRREANLICLICNVRLGISRKLADAIWVEPVALQPA